MGIRKMLQGLIARMHKKPRTQDEKDSDFKTFLEVARLVFEGKQKDVTEYQNGIISNALVQIHLLDLTV